MAVIPTESAPMLMTTVPKTSPSPMSRPLAGAPPKATPPAASGALIPLSASDISGFNNLFHQISGRLPALFKPYWHQWARPQGEPWALMVMASNGRPSLRIERWASGYRIVGLSEHGENLYVDRALSLHAALHRAGLS